MAVQLKLTRGEKEGKDSYHLRLVQCDHVQVFRLPLNVVLLHPLTQSATSRQQCHDDIHTILFIKETGDRGGSSKRGMECLLYKPSRFRERKRIQMQSPLEGHHVNCCRNDQKFSPMWSAYMKIPLAFSCNSSRSNNEYSSRMITSEVRVYARLKTLQYYQNAAKLVHLLPNPWKSVFT